MTERGTPVLVEFRLRDHEVMVSESRARFLDETADHAMEIHRDDGLYRHLRFAKPGTSAYYFDLLTWPGYLTVTGDCGTFVFSRITDMFEFFRPSGPGADRWRINPQYWSEKLRAPSPDAAERYSEDVFKAYVTRWFEDAAEELEPDEISSLAEALRERVLLDAYSEYEAHSLLAAFSHNGRRIHDSWEWNLREWDWSFLWCCWAIVWGIGRYDAATT